MPDEIDEHVEGIVVADAVAADQDVVVKPEQVEWAMIVDAASARLQAAMDVAAEQLWYQTVATACARYFQ